MWRRSIRVVVGAHGVFYEFCSYAARAVELACRKLFAVPEKSIHHGHTLHRHFSFFDMTPGFDSKGFAKYSGTFESTYFGKLQRKRLIYCEFNNFTENNTHKQIIKSTLLLMTASPEVKTARKRQLRTLLMSFTQNFGNIKH